MEEQSKQCVLGGESAEVEADFVSLSKKITGTILHSVS